MLAETRMKFASTIAKETSMHPEAISHFICCVAETVNISDLQTIHEMFYQTLKNLEQKPNLRN